MSISVEQFADATMAYNAMVRLGEAGGNASGQPKIAPGVDGIRYQTSFYPPDGTSDWAFSFAKGSRVVTIKTDQTTSAYAYNVGVSIVSKF